MSSAKPDCLERVEDILRKADKNKMLSGFDFSILMQRLLIPEGGYVIDTGNWENVNAACAFKLEQKIKKHPWIWKTFFMFG